MDLSGRKMAVVPFKLWEDMKRWKEEQVQKPRLPPNPQISTTASLQRDLSSVMSKDDISEAEKSQLFGQTLHKFQTAHRKALNETKLSLPPLSTESEMKINQRVLDSVPTTMRKKARLLLSMLQDNPNMSWNEDGTVRLYGKPVSGSNIIDLVNDVLRQRKGIDPRGWQPFAEGLRDANVPQDFVGNKKRWEFMHRKKDTPVSPTDDFEDEDVFVTPKSVKKRKTRQTSASTVKTGRRRIKEERMSAKRQLDPVWLSYDKQ